jgi:hypothetical protein
MKSPDRVQLARGLLSLVNHAQAKADMRLLTLTLTLTLILT